ncbi:di-heme oxidoredictase family protein [Dyella amyloliquefaciens]|uniref:di-heme oxidoreductase family protein n=1 Tax=Dyella amyloliquefaciens TaxID=1770545 RepID=UPI0013EEAD16|nr:di-heme oxidoredictase family protein [Dyella amyloliquefaciens]
MATAGWANERSRLALTQTLPAESPAQAAQRTQGASVFNQPWLIAPSLAQPEFDGLGPLYNALSCGACHLLNGRGDMPDSGPPLRSAIVRLSTRDKQGAVVDEPHYGVQLQTEGIPGVPAEAQLSVRWVEQSSAWLDGQTIRLRAPKLQVRALGYGPLAEGTMLSLRMAPSITAAGLLEAVPESALLAIAQEQLAQGQGVHGQANRVWDIATRSVALGRFGWKANQPSVRQQTQVALHEDMGITSSLLASPNCMPEQRACLDAPDGGHPEITDDLLDALVAYQQSLVPPSQQAPTRETSEGSALFERIGCASCHRPNLPVDAPVASKLGASEIHPYTDLLLHDMGDGLADGRPDGLASGRQWRTAPLWGLGLAPLIRPGALYLHDGRARSVTEAILWHGGEASNAVRRYRELDASQRRAVLAFLSSL